MNYDKPFLTYDALIQKLKNYKTIKSCVKK